MIAGILLAAGQSSRMGQPKALLPFQGTTFIDSILDKLVEIGCQPIIIILGEAAEMICKQSGVNAFRCFLNPHPEYGMIYSLQIAIEHLPPEVDGFFLTLVDHPLVKLETYQFLSQQAQENPDRIIIPDYHGEHGHPVYFGRKYFDYLLHAPENEGARSVVQQFLKEVNFIPVEDEGVIRDIDTPEEFARHVH